MFRRKACRQQIAQHGNERRRRSAEQCHRGRIRLANLNRKTDGTEQDAMALVTQQLQCPVSKVVDKIGYLSDDALGTQYSLFPDV